jgi:hypothetical protein
MKISFVTAVGQGTMPDQQGHYAIEEAQMQLDKSRQYASARIHSSATRYTYARQGERIHQWREFWHNREEFVQKTEFRGFRSFSDRFGVKMLVY